MTTRYVVIALYPGAWGLLDLITKDEVFGVRHSTLQSAAASCDLHNRAYAEFRRRA